MQKITSVSNNIIKEAVDFKSGKGDYILIEGEKLITEAVVNGYKIHRLFIDENKPEFLSNKFEVNDENIYLITSHILNKLSDTITPQGIIAVVKTPATSLQPLKTRFLVLDGIQDPGNFGTILRSAFGAGFDSIYAINCVNYLNSKVIRASMGAVFAVNIFNVSYEKFQQIIKPHITTQNCHLLCADMNGENIFSFKPDKKYLGIVMGSEAKGVSEQLTKLCTKTISIPMNKKLESLNVSVAASIIMYVLNNA